MLALMRPCGGQSQSLAHAPMDPGSVTQMAPVTRSVVISSLSWRYEGALEKAFGPLFPVVNEHLMATFPTQDIPGFLTPPSTPVLVLLPTESTNFTGLAGGSPPGSDAADAPPPANQTIFLAYGQAPTFSLLPCSSAFDLAKDAPNVSLRLKQSMLV